MVAKHFFSFLRILILDIPLSACFILLLFLLSVLHIHDTYLTKLMTSTSFTTERSEREYTYYDRYCTYEDMSTHNVADLLLPSNSTVDHAVNNMMTHGVSIFPNVVSQKNAMKLRQHIKKRNIELDMLQQYAYGHSWWANWGHPSNDPSYMPVLKQVAHNDLLHSTLEILLGRNPALVEIGFVTAGYGNKAMSYHSDTVEETNYLKYAQTFFPMYSVFVYLQNTTDSMGATGVCPGTQSCYVVEDDLCLDFGMQLGGARANGQKEENIPHHGQEKWNTRASSHLVAGDIAVINNQMYHRGEAHIDPNSPPRVMMILTFTSRPAYSNSVKIPNYHPKIESRIPSLGVLWAMDWKGYGHTWNDLYNPEKTFQVHPIWMILRSLGVYKPRVSEWGWDYTTMMVIRSQNSGNEMDEHNLDDFLNTGWSYFDMDKIPQILLGVVKDDGNVWDQWFVDTLYRCIAACLILNIVVFSVYAGILTVLNLMRHLLGQRQQRQKSVKPGDIAAKKRDSNSETPTVSSHLVYTHGVPTLIAILALYYLSSTQWAKEVQSNKLLASRRQISPSAVRSNNKYHSHRETWSYIQTVEAPSRNDILISDRAMHAHDRLFLDHHPGNMKWKRHIASLSSYYHQYKGMPNIFRDEIICSINQEVTQLRNTFCGKSNMLQIRYKETQSRPLKQHKDHGRFLNQNDQGDWIQLSLGEAMKITKMELDKYTNKLYEVLDDGLLYIESWKWEGAFRNTILIERYVPLFLKKWRHLIFFCKEESKNKVEAESVIASICDLNDKRVESDYRHTPVVNTEYSSRSTTSMKILPTFQKHKSTKVVSPCDISTSHNFHTMMKQQKKKDAVHYMPHNSTNVVEEERQHVQTRMIQKGDDVELWLGGISTKWMRGTVVDGPTVSVSGNMYDVELESGVIAKDVASMTLRLGF